MNEIREKDSAWGSPSHVALLGNWAATSSSIVELGAAAGSLLFCPESSSPTDQQAQPRDKRSTSLSNQRVLLVEDDPSSAKAMQGILRSYGMDVLICATVQSALQALRTQVFQFLVLDLMLPDGDGSIVLNEVRQRKLGTWVCVVTAANDPVLLERVNRLQPQRVLRKPIDIGELLSGLNIPQ